LLLQVVLMDELEATDTAAGEGAGVRGSPGTRLPTDRAADHAWWRTRRRGGDFELD
jgi:hypothetical protein